MGKSTKIFARCDPAFQRDLAELSAGSARIKDAILYL